jgi:hypothetical protein
MSERKDDWQNKRARMCDSICDILRDAGHLPPAGLDESTLLAVVRRLADAEQAARAAWVPVTERKPNDGKRVLICDERNEVERGVWDGAYWWDDGSNQASPTHWMPLPEPPPSPVAGGPGGAERSKA